MPSTSADASSPSSTSSDEETLASSDASLAVATRLTTYRLPGSPIDSDKSSDTASEQDEGDDRTPRRVLRARKSVLLALECMWTIILRKDDNTREAVKQDDSLAVGVNQPWRTLTSQIGILRESVRDERVLGNLPIKQCFGTCRQKHYFELLERVGLS